MDTYKITYTYGKDSSTSSIRYINSKTESDAERDVKQLLADDLGIEPTIINIENITFRYKDKGFNSRDEYLDSLADNYDIEETPVYALADILGPEEDFDGLVTSIEDYMDMFM